MSQLSQKGESSVESADAPRGRDVRAPPPPTSGALQERRVRLSDGTKMQVLTQQPTIRQGAAGAGGAIRRPLLLFLHGSFHGAWCWSEHWFGYFASSLGYPVAAPSWRGTGGTYAGDGVKKVPIRAHVKDLHELLTQHRRELLPLSDDRDSDALLPVVLVSHSFGGLVIMKLLEAHPELLEGVSNVRVAGIATLCSVPPSGNGAMTARYLRRSLRASWKVTAGLAMKRVLTDRGLCRELFFSTPSDSPGDGALSDEDLARYQVYFARDSEATIDLLDLARQLPSAKADANGRAPFFRLLPPCLVVGALHDYIVDREGVEEMARYYDLVEPLWVDSPHDVMLTRHWTQAATAVARWLSEEVVQDRGNSL